MVEDDIDGWTVPANDEAAWRKAITRAGRSGSVQLFELTSDGDKPIADDAVEKEMTARLDRWLVSTS
jgi:hypothetical protein